MPEFLDATSTLVLAVLIPLIHLSGFYCAYRAIVYTRTAQGAIAWAVSLVTLPYVAVPLYVVFGRRKFVGYVKSRRAGDLEINHVAAACAHSVSEMRSDFSVERPGLIAVENLAKMPFTAGNDAELLIDGEAAFESIFAGIDAAEEYILIQFYIVRDDELGMDLHRRMVAKARAGVRVYFLYDTIGSYQLSKSYLDELGEAGVNVRAFLTTRGPNNRFQINFRNHRKIVITDGRQVWVGGLNVGDEYLGRDPKIGAWRDTHCRVEGPVVQCVQLSFLEDWFFATGGLPSLNWTPEASQKGEVDCLALPSGPADSQETASLFFVHAINSARERIWIASPYFVPDDRVVGALQLAALRGVDVRILLPAKPDHLMVYLSSFSYLAELGDVGISIYRYEPGFLHQKTLLIDDLVSVVGTANLDNRSFRLNFEISMIFLDRGFNSQMEEMFEADFSHSRVVDGSQLEGRSSWFKFIVKLSRLMAPVQ